jgi:tyrosinase
MSDPDAAALDPIFWLHHANVDRLWSVWDDPSHANPTDAAWANQQFQFFDENGGQVSMRCQDVGDIVNQLDYTYERRVRFPNLRLRPEILERFRRRPPWPPWLEELIPLPRPPEPGPELRPEVVGGTQQPVQLVGSPERVRVPIDVRAQRDALGDAAPQQIVLDLENIEAERNPGTVYGVYVNLPEDASPDDLAAHHAGNVSLFGIERIRNPRGDDHPHGGMQVAMDITDLVANLTKKRQWDGEDINVTFLPIGLDVVEDAPDVDAVRDEMQRSQHHEDVPISVGRVSIQMR